MHPLDKQWEPYVSPDGTTERMLTQEMAALLYPDWVSVSDGYKRRADDALELDRNDGADPGAAGGCVGPTDETETNKKGEE